MSITFSEVEIGDELPRWARRTWFAEWNRYAAVNDEFVPFHMDDEAGRRAGNEQGAFGMGNLRYAYIVNALHTWIGDDARIHEVACQYRAINQKNDVLTVTGTVTDKKTEDGEQRVYLDINVVTEDDQSTCPGHAIVALP